MVRFAVYAMVFLGAALMVFNVIGFINFTRYVQGLSAWKRKNVILNIPVVLLIFFLLGYIGVGVFGKPDLLVAGILFGGSIFVYIMYKLLSSITQQIVESERLESKLMAEEESNRVRNSFLSLISHEMRTPMNVILGLNELELKNAMLPQDSRVRLEKVGQSARHLLSLINNILDINRIESGAAEVKSVPFSLQEALDQVNAIVQTLCEEKKLNYAFSQQEQTWGWYLGDVLQIKQVLLSILENAVKYTDASGTVRFLVESAGESEGRRTLRFIVEDTGIGIDPEFLPKLFHAFNQEDSSATNQYGGIGLSLTITKKLVELMGGRIDVQSEKHRGSVFTIELPLAVTDCPRKPESEEPVEPAELSGRRVLLAEDIPENAEIVVDLLDLEDVRTEHAENGQIALDMFARSEEGYYDAILMDLRMPVMDGLESARRIRALDRPDARTVPIIALTANAFESDVRATLDAGINVHMAKPADADILYDTLRKLIAQAEKERMIDR